MIDIQDIREAFKESSDAESSNRSKALEDIKFARLGEQWPEAARKQREQEGRPCLTINKLPSYIRQVANESRINKVGIRVRPVDDKADIQTAKVMTGIIRHIENQSKADVAYQTALDFALSGGFGYFRVNTKYACDDSWEQDIFIERISNPFSVYGDPKSTAFTAEDWVYAFVVDDMSEKEFKAKYPKADYTPFDGDYTVNQQWYKGKTLQVAEYWHKEKVPGKIVRLSSGLVVDADEYLKNKEYFDVEGLTVEGEREILRHKITQYLCSGKEILKETPWPGRFIPICPVYGEEVVIEGERSFLSLVRFAVDSQRNFNYWRTASTELVALAPKNPFIGPVGAFATDADKWAQANTVSYPYIEYDGAMPPQRQPFVGPPAGALQEAMNASDDMKAVMGLFDASMGQVSNERSGAAINARKREGDVSTYHFIDNLGRAIEYCGQVLVDLIPKIYVGERIIRILGEDGTPQPVPINMQQQQDDGSMLTIHDLSTGKYDVVMDTGPGYGTRREEMTAGMQELIKQAPQIFPVIGDILVKNMDWPMADEIGERLKALVPPQAMGGGNNPEVMQVKQQAEQMIQQMSQQLQQASGELNQLKANEQNKQAEYAIKQKELELKAYEAQVERQRLEQEQAAEAARLQQEREIALANLALEQEKIRLEMAKIEQADRAKHADMCDKDNDRQHAMQMATMAPQMPEKEESEPKEASHPPPPINVTVPITVVESSKATKKKGKVKKNADGSYDFEATEDVD